MNSFGPHLLLDFYADPYHLGNENYWKGLLGEIVDLIGMTPISPPFVYRSECENKNWDPPKATGLSGFIVLAESHVSFSTPIAFHTFVEAEFVFMDIFSCKPFDYETVETFLVERLGARDFDSTTVMRGFHFPQRKNV